MRIKWTVLFLVGAIGFYALAAQHPAIAQEESLATTPPRRVYSTLLDPREHPDFDRRHVQPPSWDTFDGRTHFAVLRGFGMQEGKAVGFVEEIEKYVEQYALGDVLWPSYDLIFAQNLGEVLEEIKRRNLFLFDIWGYVPGSGPGGYWQQFHPPDGVFKLLESKLGDHWLGMDIGEQDGRYAGGYAPRVYPISTDRFSQYLNFQRHFDRMTTELGNKNATLVSLNFGHYFLKEGVYTCIGAETAQGLPNAQVYYAFIRGAGKQYGVPWFGNASVWNRWGWKNYDSEGDDHGPTKGTSLSLLKRLMYSHLLYNCLFVGFESAWFQGDGLSPIGRIQQSAVQWVNEHGQPGVQVTPAALLFDFNAGWTFPRHLYSGSVYRVWGNLPYGPGDYLADGVLDMLYPGYQDSSFYHDESGFLSPTPYGDGADCLLSDAPLWVMERYPQLIVTSEVQGGVELREKLDAYVRGGGHLVITAGNLDAFPAGLCGIASPGPTVQVAPGASIDGPRGALAEGNAFAVAEIGLPPEAVITYQHEGQPLVAELPFGKGRVTLFATPFGLPAEAVVPAPIRSEIDAPLAKPYPLLSHVREALDSVLREQVLFSAGEGLSLIVCRKAAGEYTLGIANNSLSAAPFEIVSHIGAIEALEEWVLDDSEKAAEGYLPTGQEDAAVGASGASTIAGGDVRVFSVRVRETDVEEIPHTQPSRDTAISILPLRNTGSIKEAILARPTFFEHFAGVSIDWRDLDRLSVAFIEAEAAWLDRQSVRVLVDLTSGINLFPDLRLIDNDPVAYAASMASISRILLKAETLGARDILLSLHRVPENNFTREQTMESFQTTISALCAEAATRGITVHLRTQSSGMGLREMLAFAQSTEAPNLRLAPNLGLLVHENKEAAQVLEILGDRVGLLLASAVEEDINGSPWTAQATMSGRLDAAEIAPWREAFPAVPVLLDAVFPDTDAEYLDVALLE